SAVYWSSKLVNPYASDPSRKAYIERVIIAYAKKSGLDDNANAESTEHSGGTDRNAPLHVTVRFYKKDGTYITTRHVPL
ncbi:hypothetical protein BDY19DRAFT_877425, partial [Irpex rosettiformis]